MMFVLFVSLYSAFFLNYSISQVNQGLLAGLLLVIAFPLVIKKKYMKIAWFLLFSSVFMGILSIFPVQKHSQFKQVQGEIVEIRKRSRGQTIIIENNHQKLWLYQKKQIHLKPGYRVQVYGNFRSIQRKNYFFSEGFSHRGLIYKLKILSKREKSTYPIINSMSSYFSFSKYAYLYKGFLLGKRNSIPKRVLKLFKSSGTMHLMAISGLHIGIITILLVYLFGFFPVSPRFRLLFVNLILLAYLILLNFPASATRAIVFTCIMSFAQFIERRTSFKDILFLTGIFIVLVYPKIIFSLGFQLSFMATLGILLFLPVIQKAGEHLKHKWLTFLVQALMVGLSAQLFIIPIILHHFKSFNVFSLFITIPLGILLTGMLYWSLSGWVFFLFWPSMGIILLNASDLLAWMMLNILQIVEGFQYLTIKKVFPLWLWPLYYSLIVYGMVKSQKEYKLIPAMVK